MKRLVAIILVAFALLSSVTAFAVEVVPRNGEAAEVTVPTELTEFPEEKAIQIGDTNEDVEASFAEWEDGVMDPEVFAAYMEKNSEDDGEVWISWSDEVYSKYGCTTATLLYTNPSESNIGVTFEIAIFDAELIDVFGTTFREEGEVFKLALGGFEALKSGVTSSTATRLIKNNEIFEGMSEADFLIEPLELLELLASKGFMGFSKEELSSLNAEKIKKMSEIDQLKLAELGGYDPYSYYMEIAKQGVIKPGFKLEEADLHTLPGRICLPKGEYNAVFVLNGFDAWKSELSDFVIHLPITLSIKEDLPEELQSEYEITLAEKVG